MQGGRSCWAAFSRSRIDALAATVWVYLVRVGARVRARARARVRARASRTKPGVPDEVAQPPMDDDAAEAARGEGQACVKDIWGRYGGGMGEVWGGYGGVACSIT